MRLASFEAIVRALNAAKVRYLVAGGMAVLGFFSDEHRETPVDVFVDIPFAFDLEYAHAFQGEVLAGLPVHFVSVATLIRMKELANRPRDLDDIQHLRWIMDDTHDE